MKIGTLVMVITDHPSGCDDTTTYGTIGVIAEIDEKGNYRVQELHDSGFWYSADEIRELTDEEARLALQSILLKGR